jgi:predicted Zn-dependent protease
LLIATLLVIAAEVSAEAGRTAAPATVAVHPQYDAALHAYESGQYAAAAALLEQQLGQQPGCARCAHLLGKSYGRLAERAGWLEAISLARKTCSALEQAVELAPHDREALSDLIEYYRAAPAFLGGNRDKADALERRLREASEQTG